MYSGKCTLPAFPFIGSTLQTSVIHSGSARTAFRGLKGLRQAPNIQREMSCLFTRNDSLSPSSSSFQTDDTTRKGCLPPAQQQTRFLDDKTRDPGPSLWKGPMQTMDVPCFDQKLFRCRISSIVHAQHAFPAGETTSNVVGAVNCVLCGPIEFLFRESRARVRSTRSNLNILRHANAGDFGLRLSRSGEREGWA